MNGLFVLVSREHRRGEKCREQDKFHLIVYFFGSVVDQTNAFAHARQVPYLQHHFIMLTSETSR